MAPATDEATRMFAFFLIESILDTYTHSEPAISSDSPVDEKEIARNVEALKNRLRGKGRRRGMGRVESGSGRDSLPASE